jgi:hypothetical protein
MLVVNLFGGPSSGKSTCSAGIFSLLKLHGINCELITELAKDLVWEDRKEALSNQYYVWANQHHRIERLKGKVDVVITDSPTLLSVVYDRRKNVAFHDLVVTDFKKESSLNFFIQRVNVFDPIGRVHSEEESIELDNTIYRLIRKLNIDYYLIGNDVNGINLAVDTILQRISTVTMTMGLIKILN